MQFSPTCCKKTCATLPQNTTDDLTYKHKAIFYLLPLINKVPDFRSPSTFHREGKSVKKNKIHKAGEKLFLYYRAVHRIYYTLKVKYAITVEKNYFFLRQFVKTSFGMTWVSLTIVKHS